MTAAISEKEFQAQVLEFARLSGWRCYHTFDSHRSAPGFPDLVLVRPPVVFFAELKAEGGRASPEQLAWLEVLGGCEGVEARLWRPGDWPEVEEMLTRPRKRGAA
ncbi:MAG: VRR-NUC domain-containing protein [Rubrobacteraceae bacterium]